MGVNRVLTGQLTLGAGIPHARGGEPLAEDFVRHAMGIPHARGGEPTAGRFRLVGVRIPHARGGEPLPPNTRSP